MSAAEAIARLRDRFGERLTTNASVREAHGKGEGPHPLMAPDAVVFARSSEEIAAVLAACSETRTPVVPFGAGTSLEGQVQAARGGISLDLSLMDQVLEVSAEDLDCRVEAGVRREALNTQIRDQGLFFPLDPGANATLGGMAATRASGTNAVRYGTMREVTLGLTVVTPQGEIVRTGGRARKSAAGYDLTALYLGSEGTLGVISELQLRLFGIPEEIAAAVCQFPDLKSAVDAVILILQLGVPVARVELMDERQMEACVRFSGLEGFDVRPALFFEFHGGPAAVAEQIGQVRGVTASLGGGDLAWANTTEERNRLWKARHDAYWTGRRLTPGKEVVVTDACVPISRLAECIVESRAEGEAQGFACTVLGHVGDGNFHMMIPYDPTDDFERRRAEDLARAVARRAIGLGGTCTGEHGIGLHRMDLLAKQHGSITPLMRQLKQALDPGGIMNPGKLLSDVPALRGVWKQGL